MVCKLTTARLTRQLLAAQSMRCSSRAGSWPPRTAEVWEGRGVRGRIKGVCGGVRGAWPRPIVVVDLQQRCVGGEGQNQRCVWGGARGLAKADCCAWFLPSEGVARSCCQHRPRRSHRRVVSTPTVGTPLPSLPSQTRLRKWPTGTCIAHTIQIPFKPRLAHQSMSPLSSLRPQAGALRWPTGASVCTRRGAVP